MTERWTLRLIMETPDDENHFRWLVSALQKDPHVQHVDTNTVHGTAGTHSAVDVTFVPGETAPKGAFLKRLNHAFGDGGVHRPSKWDLLLAEEEPAGV